MKITNLFRKRLSVAGIFLFTILFAFTASAQVSLVSGTYTQDFNTLVSTGTSSAVPAGWLFLESGTNSNTIYTAGTGSGATGDSYSFGAASSTDRALGGLLSGSLTPTIGAFFQNNSGSVINSITINYTGEQWRMGALGREDRLVFEYSLNATGLASGTWIPVTSLDFIAPSTTGTAGARDGNNSLNRTNISFVITGLNIPSGSNFYIRWSDFNASSSDDGLAVDDFSLDFTNATATPPTIACPANIVTSNTAGQCGAIVTFPAAIASGSVTTSVQTCGPASGSFFPVGTTTICYEATGYPSVNCSFTITVNDVTPPVAVCQDITVQLNASGTATITASQVNNGSSDNCGIASMSVSPNSFSCADISSAVVNCPMDANYIASATNANSGPNGQTFVALTSGTLEKIDVISFNPLQLRVRTFVSNNLVDAFTGTILATSNIADGSANFPGFTSFTFPSPPVLTAGQQYIFEVVGSGTAYHHIPGTYASGTAVSPTNPGTDRDIPFKTYICAPGVQVTLTVTDAGGLTSTCTANVTVQDVAPPTAICQNATVILDSNGNGTLAASQINNGSTDNCAIASITVLPNNFTCADITSAPVATDLFFSEYIEGSSNNKALEIYNGTSSPVNLATGGYTIRVYANGTTTPTSTTALTGIIAPGGVFVIANTSSNATIQAVADQLSGNISFNGDDAVSLIKTGNITVDVFGSIGSDPGSEWGTGLVSTADNTLRRKPSISTGVTSNPVGFPGLAVEWDGFATDDFTGLGSHTLGSSANTVTLTVTDVNGLSSTCTANITVVDNTPPVAVCQNATVILDANGNGTLSASQVNNGSTDNCGIASMTVSPNTFTCADIGTPVTVTLTVTDAAGLTSTCISTITVIDNTPPVALCQDATVFLDANGNGTLLASQINNGSTDNCSISSVTVSPNTFNCSSINGGSSPTDLFISEYIEGSSNNKCIEIFNGTGAAVNLTAGGYQVQFYFNGSLSAGLTIPLTGTIAAGDVFVICNSGSNATMLAQADLTNGSGWFNGDDAVVLSKNSGTVVLDIFGRIGEDPGSAWGVSPLVTADKTLRRNGSVISGVTTNPGAGFPTLSTQWTSFLIDDATGLGAHTISGGSGSGTVPVTLTVTDVSGLTSTCTATVTIIDNTTPTANCQNITVELNAAGTATITASQINNGSTDACGIGMTSVSPSSFTCSNLGANNVTLTVTDVNGNVSSCVAVVTVVDVTAPVVNCQNVTVILDASGNGTITAAQVNNGSTDNCGVASVSVSPVNFNCTNTGTGVVPTDLFISEYIEGSSNNKCIEIYNGTSAAIDLAAGGYQLRIYSNGSVTPSSINLTGTIAPGQVHVVCNPSAAAAFLALANQTSGTASFNGDDAVVLFNTTTGLAVDIFGRIGEDPGVAWVSGSSQTLDRTLRRNPAILAGVTSNPSAGFPTLGSEWNVFPTDNLANLGVHTITPGNNVVTLTVTDASGNSATCMAAVTVIDNIPPAIITIASDMTVACDGSGNTSDLNAWLADNGGAVANDACGVSWDNNYSGLSDLCGSTGSATVIFTATDPSGNASSSTATFTIVDTTPAVITCPANITINNDVNACGAIVNYSATATDICSGAASITYDINPGSFFTIGTTTVTATATDACGNVSSCSFTVTVIDNQLPLISCTGDITVGNSPGFCGANVTYNAPIASDNCAFTIDQINGLPSGSLFPIGTTVNIYEVTDASGNTATCSFSVTVTDTEAPSLVSGSICPSDFSACNPVTWIAPVFQDNCPGLQVTSSHVPGSTFPSGTTLVTYTATDLSGNVSTCSFNVTLQEPSTAANSISSNREYNNICTGGDITLTLNGGTLGDGAQWIWYSGGCGILNGGTLIASGTTSITVSPATTTTYYVRAEGNCNNSACVQITVVVSTAPPLTAPVYVNVPAYGAPGYTDTIAVAPVAGATYYRWFTNNGQINGVTFNGQPAGPVQTTIPEVMITFVLPQSNYQIRVLAGNACGISGQRNTHIRGTVEAPASMTGPTQVCPGNAVTYTIPAVSGSNSPSSYLWTLVPASAGTITQSANGLSATVVFNTGFGTAQVCASGVSTFGLVGPAYCMTVSSSAPVPGAVSGNTAPCSGSTATYSIAAVPSAVSYNWTSTAGTVVSVAPGGLSATVQFPAGTFSGNVCVTASSPCGTSAPSCLAVANGFAGNPGDIIGSANGVCGASGVNYYVPTSNAMGYLWSVTSNMSISGSATNNSVSVNFLAGFTTGTVTLVASYSCGDVTKTFAVDGAPAAPIVTPADACPNTAQTYFITNVDNSNTYSWTVSGDVNDAYCTNGPCTQYFLDLGAGGGSFTVTATNGCGSAVTSSSNNCRVAMDPLNVNVYPNPTSGLVTVEFNSTNHGMYQVTVTDLSGRVITHKELKAVSGKNTHQLDLGYTNPGMYILYVKDAAGEISVHKVTKE